MIVPDIAISLVGPARSALSRELDDSATHRITARDFPHRLCRFLASHNGPVPADRAYATGKLWRGCVTGLRKAVRLACPASLVRLWFLLWWSIFKILQDHSRRI